MFFAGATAGHGGSFRRYGLLARGNAIPQAHLDELERHCNPLVEKRDKLSYDWAWDAKESKEERSFKIVQSSPRLTWPEIVDAPHHKWVTAFCARLLGQQVEVLLDMFLGKPPTKSVPTYWHQDEGYWGRNLDD